ncbi:hypothetical protein ES705_49438 [subsurface metagenome]
MDLPAVKADTADIRLDVTAIHDVDLPAVKADTADIRLDVTAIHDTDLPAVGYKIDEVPSPEGNYIISDAVLYSNDIERTTLLDTYTKLKEIRVFITGTISVYFELYANWDDREIKAQIYKNGVPYGTEHSCITIAPDEITENLDFERGDLIQIYGKKVHVDVTCKIINNRILGYFELSFAKLEGF